jgi:hypothetical protein
MEEVKDAPSTSSIEQVNDFEEPKTPELKQNHGVTLIPRPSDDPRDPLVSPKFHYGEGCVIDDAF